MAPLQLTWALIDNGRGVRPWKWAPQLCDLGTDATPHVGIKPPFQRHRGINRKFSYLLLRQANSHRNWLGRIFRAGARTLRPSGFSRPLSPQVLAQRCHRVTPHYELICSCLTQNLLAAVPAHMMLFDLCHLFNQWPSLAWSEPFKLLARKKRHHAPIRFRGIWHTHTHMVKKSCINVIRDTKTSCKLLLPLFKYVNLGSFRHYFLRRSFSQTHFLLCRVLSRHKDILSPWCLSQSYVTFY